MEPRNDLLKDEYSDEEIIGSWAKWYPHFKMWIMRCIGENHYHEKCMDSDWFEAYKKGFRAGWRTCVKEAGKRVSNGWKK